MHLKSDDRLQDDPWKLFERNKLTPINFSPGYKMSARNTQWIKKEIEWSQSGQAKEGPHGTGESRLVDPLYPFGFGLSYTTFEHKNLKIENNLTTKSGDLKVSFDLTNVGNMAGDEIPQLYIEDVRSSVITYQYQLRGFDRIFLEPGKTKRVVFTLKPEHLTLLTGKWMRL